MDEEKVYVVSTSKREEGGKWTTIRRLFPADTPIGEVHSWVQSQSSDDEGSFTAELING